MNEAIRREITEALGMQWEAFAARHRNLAQVMDREAVIAAVGARLAEDPEYQRAMSQASAAGMSSALLAELVRGVVKDWLAKIF